MRLERETMRNTPGGTEILRNIKKRIILFDLNDSGSKRFLRPPYIVWRPSVITASVYLSVSHAW